MSNSARTESAALADPSPLVAALLALAILGALGAILDAGFRAYDAHAGRQTRGLRLPPLHNRRSVETSIARIDGFIADGTIQVTPRGLMVAGSVPQPRAGEPPLSAASVPTENLAGQARQARFATARAAIETVKGAQRELNREHGTHLPVTGRLDRRWVRALG